MVVVGSQGLGAMGRLLLGSVTTGVVHHAHCPVAVIHSDENAVTDSNAPVLLGAGKRLFDGIERTDIAFERTAVLPFRDGRGYAGVRGRGLAHLDLRPG